MVPGGEFEMARLMRMRLRSHFLAISLGQSAQWRQLPHNRPTKTTALLLQPKSTGELGVICKSIFIQFPLPASDLIALLKALA